ncbi:hypothetical protein [Crenobacter cavernae]|nr:hypothetical protein [Crenobacter cavernae]
MTQAPEYSHYGEVYQVTPRPQPVGEHESCYPGDGVESDGGEA